MKKTLILFALTALITSGLFALEVNKNELNSTGDTTIEFINYTGPHKVIDSVAAIKGIGSGLGVQVAKDPSKSTSTAKNSKYYVVHAVDENETGKLDADILYIGELFKRSAGERRQGTEMIGKYLPRLLTYMADPESENKF